MKIKELIIYGKKILKENNIEDYNIITKILVKYILKMDLTEIIINEDKEISEDEKVRFNVALNKIIQGIPLQYITNNQEFMGMNFFVDENVLIPQPDTEILVEEVIEICKKYKRELKVLDICTGSGAIGISIAKNIDNAKVVLSDISSKALEIAKINAVENNVIDKIKFVESDMFDNIEGKFDIIVSNPPYIETDTINEPHLALDGGKDGLDFYRILSQNSKKYLKPNGYLCIEIGYNQKEKVEELLQNNSYKNIYCKKDLSANDRVVIGNKEEL